MHSAPCGQHATCVLAVRVTYFCKAANGVLRGVTIDYGERGSHPDPDAGQLASDPQLEIFQATYEDAFLALGAGAGGRNLLLDIERDLRNNPGRGRIARGPGCRATKRVWRPACPPGGVETPDLDPGCPVRSQARRLKPPKLDAAPVKQWVIGTDLGIDCVEICEDRPAGPSVAGSGSVRPPSGSP